VRRLHHPAPDVEWRDDHPVGPHGVEGVDRADDVDDRVERADLVQMHLLHGHLVNRGLGHRQPLKKRLRAVFACAGQRGAIDEGMDLRQAAVRVMVLRVFWALGARRVFVVVRVLVMLVGVVMVPVCVRGLGRRAFDHAKLGGRHPGAKHAVGDDVVAVDGQAAQRRAQPVKGHAGVEQRAENHVARGAVETVEIQNFHGPKRQL
jgi:hypothetical protein